MRNLFSWRGHALPLALLAALLISPTSHAQEATPAAPTLEPPDDGWQLSVTLDGDQRFADLILGGRMQMDLSDRLALAFAGDYGGFHISSNSTWDWNTQLGFELDEHWRMFGGYRMLDVKRDHAELQLKGPVLGATRES